MNKTQACLTITRPDDWHVHLRDGPLLQLVLRDTARQFARALVMPNLRPPILTTGAAREYGQRILAEVPAGMTFQPLLTLYLTDATSPSEIRRAKQSAVIQAVKYYPSGATTNSQSGVTHISKAYPALQEMEKLGLPLCVHGEVTDPEIDVFDREKIFIDRVLLPVTKVFPELKVVFEHATTQEAVDFVLASPAHVGATITPQHLMFSRNALFVGGIRPHYYCLPVLKRETHQRALISAATSGNPKFFLGTDSAPHAREAKESACGCAGCYTAHTALEFYAEVFEKADALHRLEGFASLHGANFYGVAPNVEKVTLRKQSWTIPPELSHGDIRLTPLRAGESVSWRLEP